MEISLRSKKLVAVHVHSFLKKECGHMVDLRLICPGKESFVKKKISGIHPSLGFCVSFIGGFLFLTQNQDWIPNFLPKKQEIPKLTAHKHKRLKVGPLFVILERESLDIFFL